VGSVGIVAWIAKVAFVGLVVKGFMSGEIGHRTLAVFGVLGLVAWCGLPFLPGGGLFVTPVLAVIDIALVLAVFKGDVRIT
jgi:hypothetical protein